MIAHQTGVDLGLVEKYVNKSWGQYGIDSVESSTTVGGKLYIGTGNNAGGDATVWVQDPTTNQWSIIGGQGNKF